MKRLFSVCVALLILLSGVSTLYAQNFITFDAYPNSTYTQPAAINDWGQIVGSSMPSIPDCFGGPPAFCQQGFFRDTDGTISTIGPTPSRPNYFTAATLAINQWGVAVGSITDFGGTTGWLRNTNGTVTEIFPRYYVPHAETVVDPKKFQPAFPKFLFPPMYFPEYGLMATSINDWGQIVGTIAGGYGFLREIDGTFTNFRAPDSVHYTDPQAINDLRQITGYFLGINDWNWHGFLRQRDGSFVVFDPINSTGTYALAINLGGAVTGGYTTADGIFHGFLRRRGGKIITFDPPRSVNTLATAINIRGQVVGFYLDSGGVGHGFTRSPNGRIDTFDVPGVGVSTTIAQGINDFGQITGYYTDPGGTHGFFTR